MDSQTRPLSPDTVVCARPNQVSSRVGDELVILDLDSSMYYSLDPVGARIFELLQEPTPLDALVQKVTAEFDVDASTAGADLMALVAALIAERLVEARTAHEPDVP
jgi:hypothetical protein